MQQRPISIEQRRGPNILIRFLYFFLFGLWFSGIWNAIAWMSCVTIIGLPVGLWMLNRPPQVVTLAPQRENLVIASGRFTAWRPLNTHFGYGHSGSSLLGGG